MELIALIITGEQYLLLAVALSYLRLTMLVKLLYCNYLCDITLFYKKLFLK